MDKLILHVISDVKSTKKLEDKNLVSFHTQQNLCFNRTTLEQLGIHEGMYAQYSSVNKDRREIRITIREDKPAKVLRQALACKSRWYKITNPQISRYNDYCYIRTTALIFEYLIQPLGCFEYELVVDDYCKTKQIIIHY